jgi:hypothetical protein
MVAAYSRPPRLASEKSGDPPSCADTWKPALGKIRPMSEPAPATPEINVRAVRFLVRASLAALEADFDGEKIYEVEKNLRTAAALLNQTGP